MIVSVMALNAKTLADTVEDLSELFRADEVEPVAWYGVGLFAAEA
ncbi:hypothetical protein [Nonomuraea guangzhouensis]|uniref:Uncharacterized protein n=1 Tax=Nonomuraea guangzhouensis TaxID=1291555 RepID=A0ABW4GQI9_9ACTN|nr:hypothetical protein [Nonomuraea guangzhouensis]